MRNKNTINRGKELLVILFIVFSFVFYRPWGTNNHNKQQPTVYVIETKTEYGARIDYIDSKGQPCKAEGENYTSIEKYCDKDGRTVFQYYYSMGEPVAAVNGQYGMSYGYDEQGRITSIVYLNKEGNPANNSQGFAFSNRAYYSDGRLRYEYYRDADGNPARLGAGQYGTKYFRGIAFYSDINGWIKPNLAFFANQCQWFVIIVGILLCMAFSFTRQEWALPLFASYVLFMAYITLARRNETGNINIIPFWSYMQFFQNASIRYEILNNIWLFVPFGVAVHRFVKRKTWKESAAAPFFFSAAIEMTQLLFKVGLCEMDDVISNTVGGIIGFVIADMLDRWRLIICRYTKAEM